MAIRWRRPRVVGTIAAGAILATITGVQMAGTRVPAVAVRRDTIEQHVVASGRVLTPSRISVASTTLGLVVEVPVKEGDQVKAGDLLVRLDDAEASAQLQAAKAQVAQAAARVEQLRRVGALVATESVRQSESAYDKALLDFERAERLHRSGSVAQAELDGARQALELAQSRRDAARAQAGATSPTGADTRLALAQLAQAEAAVTQAAVRLDQTRIVARRDGVVLSRLVEPGDVVQPAKTLLEIAAAGALRLVADVDERNLARVDRGLEARASADAFPQDSFTAVVDYVAPAVDPQRGTVELRFRVDAPPSYLRPDMTVSIDMTVARKEGALVLPADAVRAASSPEPWVLVPMGGKAQRRPVRIGVRGAGALEIEAGLGEGEIVLVPGDKPIALGDRVRPTLGR
jgi:HlyD family secretion protein